MKLVKLSGRSSKGRQKIRLYGDWWCVEREGSSFNPSHLFVAPVADSLYEGCWIFGDTDFDLEIIETKTIPGPDTSNE